jgi:hypothetical protein
MKRPAFVFLFLIFLGLSGAAMAQSAPLSTGEDVAFAFFKTGGQNPDFDLWAKKSKGYQNAAPALVNEYLAEEKQRLMRRWKDYNAAEDLLTIAAPVTLIVRKTQDANQAEQFSMDIAFDAGEITYFPYTHYDYNFALIPQNFEPLLRPALAPEQFRLIFAELGEKSIGPAQLFLQLQPVKAYINEPYKIDGVDQWAIICNVASLSLKSAKTGQALWDYTAPWYISPVKEKVQDLYTDAPNGVPTPQTP